MHNSTSNTKPSGDCQFQAKYCMNAAIYTVELKGGMTLFYCTKHMQLAKANGIVAAVGTWKNK